MSWFSRYKPSHLLDLNARFLWAAQSQTINRRKSRTIAKAEPPQKPNHRKSRTTANSELSKSPNNTNAKRIGKSRHRRAAGISLRAARCRAWLTAIIAAAMLLPGCNTLKLNSSAATTAQATPLTGPGLSALNSLASQLSPSSIAKKFKPSNDRQWKPELAAVPMAEVNGSLYSLKNIRNCNYVTEDDYVVNYYDREISLDQIESVDFIVVPFKQTPKLAHTMISFGLADGTYLCVSVEVRNEVGEKFNPLLGIGRQFELIYVLGDERDLIRLRTRHRDADVYVYPTIASAEQSQALFVDVMKRVNKLAVEPEFYNSITNNCTTNLAGHVNQVSPNKITYGWKVLLPGLSAKYAYDLGLLDNRVPFEDLRMYALVNDLAEEHFDDPQFSQLIRSRRYQIARAAELQQSRQPTLNGRGSQFLQTAAPQAPQGRFVRRLLNERGGRRLSESNPDDVIRRR